MCVLMTQGDGTRKGEGTCKCDKGYKGELCNECDAKYFESYRNSSYVYCRGRCFATSQCVRKLESVLFVQVLITIVVCDSKSYKFV